MNINQRPLVKICGITKPEDAEMCVAAGADALGFIFYAQSPRFIAASTARAIICGLPASVTAVGVFVNETRDVIESTIAKTGIRIAQLSGDEQPVECQGLPVKVWKAFRIRDKKRVPDIKRYRIDAAMLDGSRGGLYGGSGVRPDYAIARSMKQYHPLVLAGGLTPDNIVDAIEGVYPFAVDVNSGVESSPGKKDRRKVEMLFTRISSHYTMKS